MMQTEFMTAVFTSLILLAAITIGYFASYKPVYDEEREGKRK
ncbi:MAG TPA: hypothetical protein VJI12_03345 [archaeon]|nr:hypothetical protein [archaeon]